MAAAGLAESTEGTRVKLKPVTQAEAKAVWDSLENPSARKVAGMFEAAGQPVDPGMVARWERDGLAPGHRSWKWCGLEPSRAVSEKADIHGKSEFMKAAPVSPQLCTACRRRDVQGDLHLGIVVDGIRDIATAVFGDGSTAEARRLQRSRPRTASPS